MLGSGHGVPIDTTHFLLEVAHLCWHLLGCNARPELRPESDHQVHSSGCHPWFPQAGNHLNQCEWITALKQIELQIGVQAGPQGEDPTLCDRHRPSSCEGKHSTLL